jgi:hypothetical protein
MLLPGVECRALVGVDVFFYYDVYDVVYDVYDAYDVVYDVYDVYDV